MDIYSSGNAIVDAVGQINLVGNVVPETWYAAICHKNGKPNMNAIMILPDRLHEITFPSGRGVTIERHTPVVETTYTPRYNDTPPSIERHTYTKTITENNNIDYDRSIYPDGEKELVPVEYMSRDELTYENFKSEASILPQDKAKLRAEEELKALISYDIMKNDRHYNKDLVDAMLDYMSDILSAKRSFKSGDTEYSTAAMGNAFYRLNSIAVQYVIDKFTEVSREQKIKNKRSYLLRMLLTAPSDMETDVHATVNYDMARWNGGEA